MQMNFITIQEARNWASLFLQNHNREKRVADLLLEYYLDMSFAQILAASRDPFPEEYQNAFMKSIQAHAETGVPVQHIIGTASFYGREFEVNKDVLIPRPETEELVHSVIQQAGASQPVIADIGTGSGVIAISLALELPEARLLATDLSEEALRMASKNADIHKAPVTFYQGNFLEPVQQEQIDVIVSNPPYIAYKEKSMMDDTVTDFDPEMALFAEDDGLAAYKSIIEQIHSYKLTPSLIAFEIGYRQGEAVQTIIQQTLSGYHVEVHRDINQKDRVVLARLID